MSAGVVLELLMIMTDPGLPVPTEPRLVFCRGKEALSASVEGRAMTHRDRASTDFSLLHTVICILIHAAACLGAAAVRKHVSDIEHKSCQQKDDRHSGQDLHEKLWDTAKEAVSVPVH